MSTFTEVETPDSATLAAQGRATNPINSAWVSANAGSGKTYVLARRVIRLLLTGTKPSQLLCLTFTKAAAAEMSNRVFKILGEWAILPNDALAVELEKITGEKTDAQQLLRARQLFALSLDTPGGLKIKTIHAFCDALLHQFPLEANVPAHFDQIDTPEQKALLAEATRKTVLASLGRGQKPQRLAIALAEAFGTIRAHASQAAIDKAIACLIEKRDDFDNWVKGDLASAMNSLWQQHALTRQTSVEDIAKDANRHSLFKEPQLQEYAKFAAADGGVTLAALAESITQLLQSEDEVEKLNLRAEIFLTQKGEPRKQFGTKAFTDSRVGLREKFERETDILLQQIERVKTAKILHASEALFTIVQAILTEYTNLKQRRGLLDFNDLIRKTADLLDRNEIRGWVQYKLDRGIDHVLVDEAQDTSPLQWQVINAITEEFFAGQGARDANRTLFVVGDEKQSIYSFQGADPYEFEEQYRQLKERSSQAKMSFERVKLELSFRSTQEILSAVDQVFSLEQNARGLSILDSLQPHSAHRATDRGEVILWPMIARPDKPKKTHWLDPVDKAKIDEAEEVLARRIAGEIKGWIERGEKLPGRAKPIRAGDILILLRKRDRFVQAITRALKGVRLPTAGADRLKLAEHIAVEDMLALGRFAMMQADDLSLAALLKSPLFDLDENELFQLAHGRATATLFQQMENFASDNISLNAKIAAAYNMLTDLVDAAQLLPVYEFFANIFAKYDLRRKYLARLGNEVEEVIDGFLQAALNHDRNAAKGLVAFVEWLSTSNPEIKREIDLEADEIRVITVHSAKGLEAPIVILVDPGSAAFDRRFLPPIAIIKDNKGRDAMVWQASKDDRIEAGSEYFDKVEQSAEEEYRRLLYVGMTRSADRLIICGYGSQEIKYDHWHSMVMKGLEGAKIDKNLDGRLEAQKDETGEINAWHWKIDNRQYRKKKLVSPTPKKPANAEIPGWLKQPAPQEAQPPGHLTPSGVFQLLNIAPDSIFSNEPADKSALQFGNAVHRLLQILPEIPHGRQGATIKAFLDGFTENFDNTARTKIKNSVTQIIDSPQMAGLFGDNSRAEVTLTGTIKIGSNEHIVRGQIDRLVVDGEKIIIADYKTNKNIPHSVSAVPRDYIIQLALYRHLLRQIYPGNKIKTLLVWTEGPQIMDIPDAALDRELAVLNLN